MTNLKKTLKFRYLFLVFFSGIFISEDIARARDNDNTNIVGNNNDVVDNEPVEEFGLDLVNRYPDIQFTRYQRMMFSNHTHGQQDQILNITNTSNDSINSSV